MKTRLATKKEMKELIHWIALKDWETSVAYAGTIGWEDVQKGKNNFIKETSEKLAEWSGELAIADEYDNGMIEFTIKYNYYDREKREAIVTSTRIVNFKNKYKYSYDWDYYDIDEVKLELENEGIKKPGAPKRPSDKSITATWSIRKHRKEGMKIDEACKKAGIAKSTFYRTEKYLKKNYKVLSNLDFINPNSEQKK